MGLRWIQIAFIASGARLLGAQDPASFEFFEKHIRPIFVNECYSCHSQADQVKGGLRLDWKGGWQRGGDSGPAIAPGKPARSLLLTAVRYGDPDLQMPPKKQLTPQQVQALEEWIAMGAPDPRDTSSTTESETQRDLEAARAFWAFQRIGRPAPPTVKQGHWPKSELDYFVLKGLEDRGLEPANDASDLTLLRRLYFNLTGLPPRPDEIKAFEAAPHREWAIERIVDDLLSRPAFGERWGRHWLDIARFSESTGGGRTLLMKEAWRYRDYVISAFNDDKPYSEFIREQIAGDLLRSPSLAEKREHLVATAFLLLGPTNYELQDKTVLEMDIIDEQLDTLGKAFLGLTIGCARCHDHKFDPISTEDYYGLAGILKGTQSVIHSNVSTWNTRPLPLPPDQEALAGRQAKQLTALSKEIKTLKQALEPTEGTIRPIASTTLPGIVIDNAQAKLVGSWAHSSSVKNYVDTEYLYASAGNGEKRVTYPVSLKTPGPYEVRVSHAPHANRSSKTTITIHHRTGQTRQLVNQRKRPPLGGYFVSLGTFDFDAGDQEVVSITTAGSNGVVVADAVQLVPPGTPTPLALKMPQADEDSRERDERERRLRELETEHQALKQTAIQRTPIIAAQDGAAPSDIPIALRGDANNPGRTTPRSFVRVAHQGALPRIPESESGRRELAEWIASPDNPLTARVYVNRIWYHLFGRGIFPNLDNVGHMGQPPSNPALLEFLARRLIDSGWSTKSLIRDIVLSRTYRLDSDEHHPSARADLENTLFWRQNVRRLDAEAIRDSILSVSQELDFAIGGPTIKPGTKIEYGYQFEGSRRSLYTPVFRNTPLEILAVFDFADPNIVVGQRTQSSVATQALYLMNSPFVRDQAKAAADQLLKTPFPDQATRIAEAYLAALGRYPTPGEARLMTEFLARQDDATEAWAQIVHGLFASIEFRFLN